MAETLSDSQKLLRRSLSDASDLAIAYAGAVVPPLGNLTPEGLLEDFGRLNEARKALEKTEKIVKQRLISQMEEGTTTLRGDNFNVKIAQQERTALDQTSAKEYLEKEGILEEYMKTTPVETVTVKRN